MGYVKFSNIFKTAFEKCDHLIQFSPKRDHVGTIFKTTVPKKMKKFPLGNLFQVAKKQQHTVKCMPNFNHCIRQ